MLVRLNLATKRITRAEAQQEISQLIGEYPDILGLRLSAAVVAGTAEYSEDTIADLRQLDREYPGNSDIQETLGAALFRIPQTRVEAWEQFRSVLSRRPLASPNRAAAYSLGKEVAPIEASEALNGAGAVTRFLIRTRARGGRVRALLALLFVGAIVGAFSRPFGLILLSVGTLGAVWLAASNCAICCWKCVKAVLAVVFCAWALFAFAVLASAGRIGKSAGSNPFRPAGYATGAETGDCYGRELGDTNSTGQHVIAVATFVRSASSMQIRDFIMEQFQSPRSIGMWCNFYSSTAYLDGTDLLWITGSPSQKLRYERLIESKLKSSHLISAVEGGTGLWYASRP
jgi:hypothetical protein